MKLLQVADQNKPYYSADYTKGFNDGAKAQYEADRKDAERHGRWIKKYRGNYLCSVCGAWYRTTDEYGNIIDGEMTANYCESCGAKMDEVEDGLNR